MRVTVFGANGKVGSLIVAELLKRGNKVTAFVHSSSRLSAHPSLKVVQGDINDASIVAEAVKGSSAVISALGSWGTASKDILTKGMQTIIPAMESQDVSRIISLTGVEARTSHDSNQLLHQLSHTILSALGMKILLDGERHIALLEQSNLDWTVVRSPIMNEKGSAVGYKLTEDWPPIWATINRSSVVLAMVDLLTTTARSHKAPFIVRA